VITTITKEGIPLIRYRTRDITRFIPEPCICGRTHRRLKRMSGRSDDMLIIRGVNVFPSQIESVLITIEGVEPHYQLLVDREGNLDTLEVQVEVNEQTFSDEVKVLQHLSRSNPERKSRICSGSPVGCGWSNRKPSPAAKAKPSGSSTIGEGLIPPVAAKGEGV
jgi:phenylacetate-coenzyme A ligase PaaK-like adenylate-forming protein